MNSSVCTALCLILAPLSVVVYDPGGLIPSGPIKFTVVAVIVLLVLATTERVSRVVPMAYSGLALAAWLTIASIVGSDCYHAFVGTPDRRFGLFSWLLVIAAVVGGSRLGPNERTALTKGSVLAAVLIGLIAAAQAIGWTPSGSATAGQRWSGLYGQPTVFAMAALFYGIVSIGVWRDCDAPRWWRAAAVVGSLGCAAALVGSGSRGPLLAAAVIAIVGASAAKRWSVLLVVPVVALGIGIVFNRRSFSRLDEWEIGLRAVAERPIVGYGPEGYRTVFGRFVTQDYVEKYGSEVFTDRAHSGLIDLALAGGVVAVVLYLLALGLIGRHVLSRRGSLTPADKALAFAIVAYLMAQQALFPLVVLDPIVALGLGSLLARSTPAATSVAQTLWRLPFVVAATAVAWFGIAEVRAEHMLATEAASNVVDPDVVLDAVALAPHSIRVRYVGAQLLHNKGSILDLDAALDQLEAGLERSPNDPALGARYLELLDERALRSGSEEDIARAREVRERQERIPTK